VYRAPDCIPAFPAQQLRRNIPVVTGNQTIIQDSVDLRPPTAGASISGPAIGNGQFLCGNVATTYYTVTPMKVPSPNSSSYKQ
jgi:hypothetical protein